MLTLTYATHSDGYFPVLQQSAHHYGFRLEVLGWGLIWLDSITRLKCYKSRLEQLPAQEIVLVVDAYDVVLVAPAQVLQHQFEQSKQAILISNQRYFPHTWVMRSLADYVMGVDFNGNYRNWLKKEAYGRPCMGALVGRAGALVALFSSLLEIERELNKQHDQIALNTYMQRTERFSQIDNQCRVFQSLWRTRGAFPGRGQFHLEDAQAEIELLDGRLYNPETQTSPSVIHAPFSLDIDPLLQSLGYDLQHSQKVSRRRYFQYSISVYIGIFFRRLFSRFRSGWRRFT